MLSVSKSGLLCTDPAEIDLTLIALQVATTGDRKGRGQDVLAVENLVTKYTFGWTGEALIWTLKSSSNRNIAFNEAKCETQETMHI